MLGADDSLDLQTLGARLRAGAVRPRDVVAGVLDRVAARGDDKVWIRLTPRGALQARAAALERLGPAGLALYGVSPFGGETAYSHGLKPVMALETTVLTVRSVKRGETVGYAGAWRAERDSTIAILAAGYGDGLPRHLPNGTPVLVGGARYDLVGRVSMDMIAVDVTSGSGVTTGNKAIIWGDGLPVEEVAAHAGTIPYELLCGVSQRVPLELK